MAVTQIAFGEIGDAGNGAGVIPAMIASTITSESITPSGSNQQTTATAPKVGRRPGVRIATDTQVYVAVGANPNALSDTTARILLPAGAVEYLMCAGGDKVAVVNG